MTVIEQSIAQVMTELRDNRMYFRAHGKRKAASGPAHVVHYEYPFSGHGEGFMRYKDSLGTVVLCGIPPEMVPKVQAMWETVREHL